MSAILAFHNTQELEKRVIRDRVGKILLNDTWVCIVWDGTKLYAFDEKCPHQDYSLAGSICKDGNIVCPLHQFRFNLKNMSGHGLSLHSYEVQKRGEAYYILL